MHLSVQGLTQVVGGEPHLAAVDLELEAGSFNVLLGPTQAGKTTLLRILAGLDRPSAGVLREDGRDVTGLGVRGRRVAMVYQEFVNYPSFTVYQNIAAPLRIARRLSRREIDRRVRATAERLHIGHLLDRLPAELSGGQQQRVALARALVKEAPLLLLDEPLVNLDYKLREELRDEMRQMFLEGETTVVYATTEPQEALLLGGATAVLDRGRLLQHGPALEVYHRPTSERVAEVFSDPPINLMPARIDKGWCALSEEVAFALPSHMRALPAGPYRVAARADQVAVGDGAPGAIVLPARVELAEINGSETFIHARHGALSLIALVAGVHGFELGQQVRCHFDPAGLFVFDQAGAVAALPGDGAEDRR